ncbi:hypothetical protein QEG98_03395 [Myxococcus sp. MxC21-1]|uniref:hypothetical protein n=1 Tax=Myxococcus sp. MxC21-1 TaxID=3041439 RepID=UPI00292DC015|nr:hypothetical protein [Myxococcus sp. MxC21-1]WNZ62875.1 hypothetical protein QEG98_03395 [Myxococcus sp. MxC21-1]
MHRRVVVLAFLALVATACSDASEAGPADSGTVLPDGGGDAGTPTRALELWTARATLAPGTPPVTYAAGRLVMHDGQLYRARSASTEQVPPEHPAVWERLPPPVDDLRTALGSEWTERGVGLQP